jgi:CRISPR-associated protein Csd1
MGDALERLRNHLPLKDLSIDPDVKMHLLGLAPNAARIAIRYYYVNSLGSFAQRIAQHYEDMDIVHGPSDPPWLSPFWILRETAAQGKSENIPSTLGGALMRAVYTGQAYPTNLYAAMLMRIRSDKTVNRTRAAFLKAYILRGARLRQDTTSTDKSEAIKVALNETWASPGYLMGRLFALMEKAQLDALGSGIGSTIKDRYFGAASAAPVTVFPPLLRLSQHHLSKARSGHYLDREIQRVVDMMPVDAEHPSGFPAKLDLEAQGLFAIGYYQQKQALYTKRSTDEEETT